MGLTPTCIYSQGISRSLSDLTRFWHVSKESWSVAIKYHIFMDIRRLWTVYVLTTKI